jgi:hypothetical protein
MVHALCPRCGASKKRPWRKCASCGLDPKADEDALVESVYLSVERFDEGDDRKRYAKELDELAVRMRAGERPAFDARAIARLRRQKRLVESVPYSAVWGAVFRLFFPAIVVLAVLATIVIVQRL